MYDGIVAHIDPHMAAVTDDIAGLCIGKADPVSAASQSRGAVGRPTPKFAYTLMTKPEQSVPLVRLEPPYT